MYEIVQHTADIRIHVRADSMESLFADALIALMEVLYENAADVGGATQKQETLIESLDCTALLVDFLNDALTRCHVHRRRYTAAAFTLLTETALTATLTSVAAGDFHEDVKAVTYHEADVQGDADGRWKTTLVLDI